MTVKILLLVLVSQLVSLAGTTECEDYVKDLVNRVKMGDFSSIPQPTLLYSGLAPNSPGQFVECRNSAGFSYYFGYLEPDFSVSGSLNVQNLLGTFMGLCVPSFCKLEDLQKIQLFNKAQIYGYDNNHINILGWVGLISFLAYTVLVLSATIARSLKVHKIIDHSRSSGRLSIQETDNEVNPTITNESMNQPVIVNIQEYETTNSIIDSFNGYENYKKIFQIDPKRNILIGPKCISVLMIVVAFEYSYRQTVAMNNQTAASMLKHSMGYVIANVQLAFAILFWIFGMNAAYSLYKIQSFTDIFRSILNKLVRTWPLIILYTLFAYGITSAFMAEPLSKLWDILYNRSCPSIFWRKWMLVNTMIPDNSTCLPWTWVFEVELLLYIISPLFIVIHRTKKWLGYSLIMLSIVCSLVFSFTILQLNKTSFYPSLLFNNEHAYVYDFQMNPLTRASQFYFGLLVGIFINHALDRLDDSDKRPTEYKVYKLLRNSRVHQWLFQIVGLAMICTSFFLIVRVEDSDSTSAFVKVFVVIIPFIMLMGLSLVLLPSFFKGEGHLTVILNYILGNNFWSPLYKLSNSIYLTAPIVIGFTTYSLQSGIYFSYQQVTLLFLGDLALTLFVSLIICSCLQIPFNEVQRRLEKFVFGSRMTESVAYIDN